MIFPDLEYTKRDNEFNTYSDLEKAQVVYGYLFDGYSHRKLDELYLGKDGSISRGWQAMGILHYLGIVGKHKKVFSGYNIDEAIEVLTQVKAQQIIKYLLLLDSINLDKVIEEFESELRKSSADSSSKRKARLVNSQKKPISLHTNLIIFKRNPDVVAEVLFRANGICEKCNNPAPFFRKSDNTPYLEVHHYIPLSEGGDDTIENAIAVCPNCHRRLHFG